MRGALAAVLLALAAPAAAQPPPPTLPTRDVSVVYRLEGAAHAALPGGLPDTVRLSWTAGAQRLRVEPDGRSQILLVDLQTHHVQVLETALRGAMNLPVRPQVLDRLRLADARLTPRGPAALDGRPCMRYDIRSNHGSGTLCVTSDGVILRASGVVDGRRGGFTAVSVDYGALPAALFRVPPGYTELALPPGR